MQHLEGSGTPVLYIGRTVLKGQPPLKLLPKLVYEGKSISKLQIVIEKKRKGIMTYKQHLLTCICLMSGVRLVKRDVRPSHDVTSDRHANLAHPAAHISQYDKKKLDGRYKESHERNKSK